MSNQPPAPFTCSYSPNLPELLLQLNCSIALSTYQAGKVIFLSPKNSDSLVQLPRNFKKAMGINVKNGKMAVATRDEVLVLVNSPDLAKFYPKNPNVYDAMFMPRATYYTGALDIHDIAWGNDNKLYAVNTFFSCLITIDDNYSFTPYWTPPFISSLASEDRCHLNGMAMVEGKPKYVTAFNNGDQPKSWRENLTKSGILMDIESNEYIAKELPMPHSPKLFGGRLMVLLSATGELVEIDINTGKYKVLYNLGGFVRGLDCHGDYLFVGLSRLRKNSSTFAKLDIAKLSNQAGIVILHIPTMTRVGEIFYQSSVDEIYDVHVLPDIMRPGILNTEKLEHKLGISIPNTTFWASAEIFEEAEKSMK